MFEKFLPVNKTNSSFLVLECKNYDKKISVTWVGVWGTGIDGKEVTGYVHNDYLS